MAQLATSLRVAQERSRGLKQLMPASNCTRYIQLVPKISRVFETKEAMQPKTALINFMIFAAQ